MFITKTEIVSIKTRDSLAKANAALQKGQIIVVPTDTVYGVVSHFDNPEALEKIYLAKGRPPSKAIPVLIGEVDQLAQLMSEEPSKQFRGLIETFWPGPLTIVVAARPTLPPILTAGGNTIAVRMPDHAWLCELIRQTGPLAATSANQSERPEATNAEQVIEQLNSRVTAIFDDGPSPGGEASTVIDMSGDIAQPPAILRAGPLAEEVSHHWASIVSAD